MLRFIERIGMFGVGLLVGVGVLLWAFNTYEETLTRRCALKGKAAIMELPSFKWKCVKEERK